MKRIFWGLAILIIAACSKEKEDTKDNYDPKPTPVGTATGEVILAMIGPDGGNVSSADGKMELIIPAGALSTNTDVTIQAVTNNTPGGRGNVYRIGPGGTVLNVPATIKLHYTEKDIEGSLAILLGVATQGTDRIWYSIPDRNIDTLNKTISITSQKLFSDTPTLKSSGYKPGATPTDWGVFVNLYIQPSGHQLKVNESKEFKVILAFNPPVNNDNEDDLPLLRPFIVKEWAANGETDNPSYGTIVPAQNASCNYKAPETKPPDSKNPVQLSAEIGNVTYRNPVTGQNMTTLILVAPVKITDDNFSYSLKLKSRIENFPSSLFLWTLTDNSTIDFDVRNGLVIVAGIHNEDGSVTPASQSIPVGNDECVSTWIYEEGATGYLNVTIAFGETGPYEFDPELRSLILTVRHNNTRVPKFLLVCGDDPPNSFGGESWHTLETTYSFILKDSVQTAESFNPYVAVTLEPRQDN